MTPSIASSSGSKLRSSCNSCGIAKVKCGRERPCCNRCSLQSSACIYGPSRKSGKPPRTTLSSTSGRVEKRASGVPHSGDRTAISSSGEFEAHRGLARKDFPNSDGGDAFAASIDTGFQEQNHVMDFYPSLQFDQFGAWPMGNLPIDFNFLPPAPCPTATTTQSSHSCPRDSYEIFRDLICPSPFLHAPDSNSTTVSAPLDEVLKFTKNGIDRLTQVLECPCAKSGHRAMVHASIVSRILIWYQQAAGCTGSSSWGYRPTQFQASEIESSTETTSQPPVAQSELDPAPLVKATGFAVEHVPLSLGAFRIEDENVQAVFRNQLVLSELKGVAGLIDLFVAQDSAESVGGLYRHLGIWLKAEHGRTVDILKTRLRTLNE